MSKPSSLTLAKTEILEHFSKAAQKIYSEPELSGVLLEKSPTWRLVKSTSVYTFITFLEQQGDLKACKFHSDAYGREITRYAWGTVSPLALALSIKSRGYLCHGSAANLHGLVPTFLGT